MKTKTLVVTDEGVKKLFKKECQRNEVEMSAVTSELWKQYIVQSVEARKKRYAEYEELKQKANENKTA